jgi:hypothetical protein
MRNLLYAMLVLAACGKDKHVADDWSKTATRTIDGSTGGVAFSIALPDNWEPRKPPDEGWGPATGDQFKRPYATVSNVSLDLASSLESAISAAGAKPEQVVRKEAKDGGYAITEVHEQTMVRATTFKRVGGSFLWCTAAQANDDGLANFEATKKALVKICDSLVAK